MKNSVKLAFAEKKFADIIWANAPLPIAELARLALEALDWKRTTVYTVLKRLEERGLFRNDNGTVRALITKEEYQSRIGESFLAESFDGSLPAFVAAFTSRQKLSKRDIEELHQLIQSYEEGNES